jgi:peptide/nickel transport system ATP-binding protein
MTTPPYFSFKNVSKFFSVRRGIFRQGRRFAALEDVSLDLNAGRIYGLVGESGSGKTTAARILTGLEAFSAGTITHRGSPLTEILRRKPGEYRQRVQMVFQNPYLSLDPRWTIRAILEEGIGHLKKCERQIRISSALEAVRLDESFLPAKPSRMSGGERQRVAIARALVMEPEYLILDEPTSQLDVSVQFQIVRLLQELRSRLRGGILFITHDIALVSHLADELVVLRAGKIVEQGAVSRILSDPQTEYTKRLLAAVPKWP